MKRTASIFFGIFILILLLPSLSLKQTKRSKCENRTLTNTFSFSLSHEFFDEFETFYTDQFGFKTELTTLNASLKYLIFNSSSNPQYAVSGKDKWAFYTDNSDNILDSYSHQDLLSPSELKALKVKWESRKIELNDLGIDYYMAVYPNKSTIYLEKIPYNMKWVQKDTVSKSTQVIDYLRQKKSLIKIIQVEKELLAQKDSIENYLRFDSHWNDLGSFEAYRKLCQEMKIKPYQLIDFERTTVWFENGDLGRLTGLCNSPLKSHYAPILTFKSGDVVEQKESTIQGIKYWQNTDTTKEKTILVFMDSYTNLMKKYLVLNFRKSYFISGNYSYDLVKKIKPDIVLVANVERYFALD